MATLASILDVERARILSVKEVALSTMLTDDITSSQTVIPVADPNVFDEEGGFLEIVEVGAGASAIGQYLSVDDDANTITLLAGIGTAFGSQSQVYVYVPNQGIAVSRYAWVRVDDTDDNNNDLTYARVPHALYDKIAAGVREPEGEEWVVIEHDGQEWVIADLLSRVPSYDLSIIPLHTHDVVGIDDTDIAGPTFLGGNTITGGTAETGLGKPFVNGGFSALYGDYTQAGWNSVAVGFAARAAPAGFSFAIAIGAGGNPDFPSAGAYARNDWAIAITGGDGRADGQHDLVIGDQLYTDWDEATNGFIEGNSFGRNFLIGDDLLISRGNRNLLFGTESYIGNPPTSALDGTDQARWNILLAHRSAGIHGSDNIFITTSTSAAGVIYGIGCVAVGTGYMYAGSYNAWQNFFYGDATQTPTADAAAFGVGSGAEGYRSGAFGIGVATARTDHVVVGNGWSGVVQLFAGLELVGLTDKPTLLAQSPQTFGGDAWTRNYDLSSFPGSNFIVNLDSITPASGLVGADPYSNIVNGRSEHTFVCFRKIDSTSKTLTITAGSGNTINGAANVVLTNQWDCVILHAAVRSNTGPTYDWHIVSGSVGGLSTGGGGVGGVGKYIPAVAGAPGAAPTGVPAGYVEARYDITNDILYIYNGAWRGVELTV